MGIRIPFCDDCKQDDPIMFMLINSIWQKISKRAYGKDILCLDCAEKRLGRKITLKDLKPCGITDQMILGVRLYHQTINMPSNDFHPFHQSGDRMTHLLPPCDAQGDAGPRERDAVLMEHLQNWARHDGRGWVFQVHCKLELVAQLAQERGFTVIPANMPEMGMFGFSVFKTPVTEDGPEEAYLLFFNPYGQVLECDQQILTAAEMEAWVVQHKDHEGFNRCDHPEEHFLGFVCFCEAQNKKSLWRGTDFRDEDDKPILDRLAAIPSPLGKVID